MKYSLLVFIGAASYGILSTIAKLSYKAGFSSEDATSSQMLFGMLFLWIIVFFQEKKISFKGLDKASVLKIMLTGIPVALTSGFYYKAVQLLPASIAVLLLFQFTWIGLLIDAVTTRKLPSAQSVWSAVIIMGGTVLASGVLNNGFEGLSSEGIIYGLLSSVSYSLFIFFNGKSPVGMSATKKSALMLSGANIITLFLYPPVFLLNSELAEGLFIYGVPLALFGAVIPPMVFAIGIPKIGVGPGSIISAAELPVAVLASSMVLNEEITPLRWAGVLIILMAMILPKLVERRKKRRKLAFS